MMPTTITSGSKGHDGSMNLAKVDRCTSCQAISVHRASLEDLCYLVNRYLNKQDTPVSPDLHTVAASDQLHKKFFYMDNWERNIKFRRKFHDSLESQATQSVYVKHKTDIVLCYMLMHPCLYSIELDNNSN